jgi:LPXTG-motif cell wall-anchored protein
VSLAVTPPADTEAPAGELVGPYVVSTTAATVTLTPSAGVTVTDGTGAPLAGPVTDGTELWLLSADPGSATLTASADATVHAGRVFAKRGIQRLILANSMETVVEAEVTAQWGEVPGSTTSTPSTTDTTVPPSTDTTVPIDPNPTVLPPPTTLVITPQPTEVPVEPGVEPVVGTLTPQADGSLPRTGNDARPLVAVAVVLLAAGGLLGLAARRRHGT